MPVSSATSNQASSYPKFPDADRFSPAKTAEFRSKVIASGARTGSVVVIEKRRPATGPVIDLTNQLAARHGAAAPNPQQRKLDLFYIPASGGNIQWMRTRMIGAERSTVFHDLNLHDDNGRKIDSDKAAKPSEETWTFPATNLPNSLKDKAVPIGLSHT